MSELIYRHFKPKVFLGQDYSVFVKTSNGVGMMVYAIVSIALKFSSPGTDDSLLIVYGDHNIRMALCIFYRVAICTGKYYYY